MVVETDFDAGIAFDGDADRMYIVDEKGSCPLQDRILASYIAFLAKRSKGPFVVPLDASMVVDEIAEKTGARLVRGPVGDAKLLRESEKVGRELRRRAVGRVDSPRLQQLPRRTLIRTIISQSSRNSWSPCVRNGQGRSGIPYDQRRYEIYWKTLPRQILQNG